MNDNGDNVVPLDPRGDGSKPITIEPASESSQPHPATVKVLEKLLAMAKTGRLQNFIGVGWTDENERVSVINVNHENIYEMLGSITFLQQEYIEMVQDTRA